MGSNPSSLSAAIPNSVSCGALVMPTGACPNCWRAWLAGSRNSIGLCWHGKVAWRVKSGALSVVPGVTREEHRAMIQYVNEMEAVCDPSAREPLSRHEASLQLDCRAGGRSPRA
jgi:hypothetical protein